MMTNTLSKRTGAVTYLAFCSAVLLAVIIPSPFRIPLLSPQGVAEITPQFPKPTHQLSEQQLAALEIRPIFNAGRVRDPVDPGSLSATDFNAYRLTGIMIGGSIAVAIVEHIRTKVSRTLRVGDSLDARTVVAISANGVVFSGPNGSETLAIPRFDATFSAIGNSK